MLRFEFKGISLAWIVIRKIEDRVLLSGNILFAYPIRSQNFNYDTRLNNIILECTRYDGRNKDEFQSLSTFFFYPSSHYNL